MTVDVFGADEQADCEVALSAMVALSRSVLEAEGVRNGAEVSLLFVDEPTIAELNERFLGHAGPTDVLSFPLEDEPLGVGAPARLGRHRTRRAARGGAAGPAGRRRRLPEGRRGQRRARRRRLRRRARAPRRARDAAPARLGPRGRRRGDGDGGAGARAAASRTGPRRGRDGDRHRRGSTRATSPCSS